MDSISNASTVGRATEVSRMMNDLEKEIANLVALVDGLGEKLSVVRTQKPPKDKANAECKMPSMCILADSLRNKVLNIQSISNKVITINEEIEL
jgi:hypothetical protein